MASNSELKQRKKAANGNANSQPALSKRHTHGSGDTDEGDEHAHAEASMIWDALRGRGSSLLSFVEALARPGFHPNARLLTTSRHSPLCATPEEFYSELFIGDRGSRAALYGLFANIGLTGLKGMAGW